MSEIEKICLWQSVEGSVGGWICPKCKTAVTLLDKHGQPQKPGRRLCGQQPVVTSRVVAPSTTTVKQAPDRANAIPTDPEFSERQYRTATSACGHRGAVLKTSVPCVLCGAKGQIFDVYKCDLYGQCTLGARGYRETPKSPLVQVCGGCPDDTTSQTTEASAQLPVVTPATTPKLAPAYTIVPLPGKPQAWRGSLTRRPWEYDVTAIIPVVNPDSSFALAIELLRLQTERPYILVIDTGSVDPAQTERYRAADLEVHYNRTHGVVHPSELVSMALDDGVSKTRTPFTFFTHSDCFLTRRTALADLKSLAEWHTVAGHQITPRQYDGWETELGHTLLMCQQDRLNQLGITWSMRRAVQTPGAIPRGIADYYSDMLAPEFANVVDTERGFNALLKAHGITPYFTGTEQNFQRNTDTWIDHIRSLSGSRLYGPEYHIMAMGWLPHAVAQAAARIADWRNTPITNG